MPDVECRRRGAGRRKCCPPPRILVRRDVLAWKGLVAQFGGKKRRFHVRIREVGAAPSFLSYVAQLPLSEDTETRRAEPLPCQERLPWKTPWQTVGASLLGANQSVTVILECGMWGRRRLTLPLLRAASRPKAPRSPDRSAVARARRDNSSRGPKVGRSMG